SCCRSPRRTTSYRSSLPPSAAPMLAVFTATIGDLPPTARRLLLEKAVLHHVEALPHRGVAPTDRTALVLPVVDRFQSGLHLLAHAVEHFINPAAPAHLDQHVEDGGPVRL